jgi:hypothetical protein
MQRGGSSLLPPLPFAGSVAKKFKLRHYPFSDLQADIVSDLVRAGIAVHVFNQRDYFAVVHGGQPGTADDLARHEVPGLPRPPDASASAGWRTHAFGWRLSGVVTALALGAAPKITAT